MKINWEEYENCQLAPKKVVIHNPYAEVLPALPCVPVLVAVISGRHLFRIPENATKILRPVSPNQRFHVAFASPNKPLAVEIVSGSGKRRFLLTREKPISLVLKGKVHLTCRSLKGGASADLSTLSLLRSVDYFLHNELVNPRKGAIPSETLKALMRRTQKPQMARALRQFGSWEEFLRSQSKTLTVFSYTPRELKSRRLDDQISPTQLRVVRRELKRFVSSPKPPGQAELALGLSKKQKKMKVEKFTGSRAFAALRSCENPEVLCQSCGSFSLMMRFLQRHNQTFRWTTDPSKKTVVSLIQRKRCDDMPAPP